jgi:hypothetical protein
MTWQDLHTGLGSIVAEIEKAQGGAEVDWSSVLEKAKGLGAGIGEAQAEHLKAVARLQAAAKHIQQLETQPGVGAPPKGVGASGQTVYISAGAAAGIALGALAIGGVGGYAVKAYSDNRKKKKAAEEPEELETEEPRRMRGKR